MLSTLGTPLLETSQSSQLTTLFVISFVQVGTADLVSRLSDAADLSAGLVIIQSSGNTLGFGS